MSSKNDKKVIHSIRTQVDSFGRKKYRLEQVAQSASQDDNEPQNDALIDTGRHKSMLIGRQQGLNIEKYLGKIETNKKKKVTEVFYCDICSQGFKCDMAYITHINSPAHNRKIGMSMKVKNVSLQTVSSKISALINKKLAKQGDEEEEGLVGQIEDDKRQSVYKGRQQKADVDQGDGENNDDQAEDQQVKKEDQIEGVKEEDKPNVQPQQQDEEDADEQAELQMMRQMGLPTAFGSKKHKR